ncbi:MAG TPA: four helix bundle protein [Gemmatimonadales bacterium]
MTIAHGVLRPLADFRVDLRTNDTRECDTPTQLQLMPRPWVSPAGHLQRRAFELAANTVKLCRQLPRSPESVVIVSQLVRASTSAAANYRAACRAQSPRTFVAKLSIALEEADETLFWYRLLVRVGLADKEGVRPLADEANQLVAILVASRKTAAGRPGNSSPQSSIVNRQ